MTVSVGILRANVNILLDELPPHNIVDLNTTNMIAPKGNFKTLKEQLDAFHRIKSTPVDDELNYQRHKYLNREHLSETTTDTIY